MTKQITDWNRTLRFSWGHIIAFLALIFITYIVYIGCVYLSGGSFLFSAIIAGVVVLSLFFTFIGAQLYKGVSKRFDRSLRRERFLVCLSIVAFIGAMIPYNHFWTIFDKRAEVEKQFSVAISSAQGIFSDYRTYSEKRIQTYEATLDSILHVSGSDARDLSSQAMKSTYLETLRLQLLSENTDSLEHVALSWIDKADSGASVWNCFLIGNVGQISEAIEGWCETLNEFSKPVLSNERRPGGVIYSYGAKPPAFRSAMSGISSVKSIFTERRGLSFNTLWTGVFLYFMLLLPYLLQRRNEKARGFYSLFRKRNREENDVTLLGQSSRGVGDDIPEGGADDIQDTSEEGMTGTSSVIRRDVNDWGSTPSDIYRGTF